MRPVTSVLLVFSLSVLFLAGCRGPAPEEGVWFVQATDPHLFHDGGEEREERTRLHQERLNQQAFEDLIQALGALPGTRAEPSFLVITGDFGLDRFATEPSEQAVEPPPPVTAPAPQAPAGGGQEEETAAESETVPAPALASPDPSSDAASAIEYLVGALAKSPVKEIFLVPGNNDVGEEEPGGRHVQEMQSLWSEVQRGLSGTGVTLHDLTACYFEGGLPSSCFTDVEGTPYRLIGFPSHSFKDGVSEGRAQIQVKQLETLASLIEQAGRQGKRALILTHVPEVDDPNTLAHRVFRAVQRYPEAGQPKREGQKDRAPELPVWAETSAWNMRGAAFESWKEAVGSSAVAGVLAGHFHDSHKEIYRRPYDWPTRSAERADLGKLYLAPPLSVRFQDESPIQARGFALFRLGEEAPPERTLYWFDWKQRTFEPEPARERAQGWAWPARPRWFWTVAGDATDLARAAVIAIAFLAAFLTIVQLWEVPPSKSPLAKPGAKEGGSASEGASGGGSPSALQGNFGKTVLAGLGGMLALSFLESLWSMEGLNTTAYYVLLFVTFFFGLLLLYAIVQSLIEALRSRLVTQYPVRPWRGREPAGEGECRHGEKPRSGKEEKEPSPKPEPPSPRAGARLARFFSWLTRLGPWFFSWLTRLGPWFRYWRTRIWYWVLSLRILLLVLFDTFFNVIRGRNQLQSKVFGDSIVALNWSIVRAADRIREEVEAVMRQVLDDLRRKAREQAKQGQSNAPALPPEEGSDERKSPEDRGADQDIREEDIRVSISVLSRDEETLFYVAREKGSLARGFDRRSVAWVSVYTGQPFWWKKSYDDQNVTLLTNSRGGLPLLPEGQITLGEYYQKRPGSDYEAFIVLPIPWGQRGTTDSVRRAGLQISFHRKKTMADLFDGLEDEHGQPSYDPWNQMLRDGDAGHPRVRDDQLRTVLLHSLRVLEELLAAFDEDVFEYSIRPQIRPH